MVAVKRFTTDTDELAALDIIAPLAVLTVADWHLQVNCTKEKHGNITLDFRT